MKNSITGAFLIILSIGIVPANAEWFINVAEPLHVEDPEPGRYVAWGDYNNDGYEDLLVTNAYGDFLSHNFKLFKNLGGTDFDDITNSCGINLDYECYCGIWGDYDNDGWLDIYFCQGRPAAGIGNPEQCPAPNRLYRYDPVNDLFVDVTFEAFGADNNEGVTTSASWGDVNNDGWLDLYVLNDQQGNCGELKQSDLFFGNGTTFSKVTDIYNVGNNRTGYGVAMADYDGDGDLDIYIANLFGANNRLYENRLNQSPSGFLDVAPDLEIDYWQESGGVEFVDIDGDLDLDLYIVNWWDENFALKWENGVYIPMTPYWHIPGPEGYDFDASFDNFDNDFDLDLCVPAWFLSHEQNELYSDILYSNEGFTFINVTEGSGIEDQERGGTAIAWADFDNNGYVDAYIVDDVSGVPGYFSNRLLQNVESWGNNYLHIKLQGTQSNFNGIGAKIYVYMGTIARMRHVEAGSGRSQSSIPIEFGCSQNEYVDSVVVVWPSGEISVFEDVATNQRITIVEPGIYHDTPEEIVWDHNIFGHYYICGELTFSNQRIEIKPGTHVYFHQAMESLGAGITFKNETELTIAGAEGNEVLFTSQHPNPAYDDWLGITVDNSSQADIDYCVIEYALNGLVSDHQSSINVNKSTFRYIRDFGFAAMTFGTPDHVVTNSNFISCGKVSAVFYGGNPSFRFNDIGGFTDYGVKYFGNGVPLITHNTITTEDQNSYWGIYVSRNSPLDVPKPYLAKDSITYFGQGGVFLEKTGANGQLDGLMRVKHNGIYGLFLVSSLPTVDGMDLSDHNTFSFSQYGIYFDKYSGGTFRWNNIKENPTGVYIKTGAFPDFGTTFNEGYNSIVSPATGYDMINMNLTSIEARGNWWGSDGPRVIGPVNTIPERTRDPIPTLEKAVVSNIPNSLDFVLSNYPNPFNANTEINFNLPYECQVEISVYDVAGRLVKTLANGYYGAGENTIVWDGKNNLGNTVASGIYLYSLTTPKRQITQKMLLLK